MLGKASRRLSESGVTKNYKVSFARGALALLAFLKVIFDNDDHFLCQDLCAGVSGDVGI